MSTSRFVAMDCVPPHDSEGAPALLRCVQAPSPAQHFFEQFELKVVTQCRRTAWSTARAAGSKDFVGNGATSIAGRYVFQSQLGKGASCTTMLCLDSFQSMKPVCVKRFFPEKDLVDQALDEIKLLAYIKELDPFDNCHLLRPLDCFYCDMTVYLVTDVFVCNLRDASLRVCDFFNMNIIRSIGSQLLIALDFLHSHGVVHADLKPDNVMLVARDSSEVRLIDFGLAGFCNDHLPPTVASPAYRAPEIVLGCGYSTPIDMWSLGCVLAELYSGQLLFDCSSVHNLLQLQTNLVGRLPRHLLAKGRDTLTYYTRVPSPPAGAPECAVLATDSCAWLSACASAHPLFCDLLVQLLQPWPAHRPTAAEALKHKFFANS